MLGKCWLVESLHSTPISAAPLLVVVVDLPQTLGMISQALELRVEGGHSSHSWCMCVVSHSYGRYGMGQG